MRAERLFLIAGALLGATACDYSGDWLFAGDVEGVPGVIHLGELTPADIATSADVDANTIYGEVGPTGTSEAGGVTFTFEGTGGHVCVWVDPELLYFSQSVSPRPTDSFAYPDNVFDDGDLDLQVGLAAYYNGSPGEEAGDFEVRYTDSLGNPVTVALNECTIGSAHVSSGAHSGRGAPEFCTVFNTQPGVQYMVLLETWSTPLDDDRLGYGLLLVNESCGDFMGVPSGQTPSSSASDECVITGEAVEPGAADAPGPWLGHDTVPTRSGSEEYERAFCNGGTDVLDFCQAEALQSDCTDPESRCFCGNLEDTPSGGSF